VRLVAGGQTQIREVSGGSGRQSQDALVASFGLGGTTTVDSLVIRWPSGIVQDVLPTPAVDGATTVVEDAFPEVQVLAPEGGLILTPGEMVEIQWSTMSHAAITGVDIHFVEQLQLYGTSGGTSSELYTIDLDTGAATSVGMITFDKVNAIAMGPFSGALYATAERTTGDVPVLITIDRVTGLGSEIGPTGISANITDLTFDRVTGVLYGHEAESAGGASADVFTFDLESGTATLLGPTMQTGIGGAMVTSWPNKMYLVLDDQFYQVNRTTGNAFFPVTLGFSSPIGAGAHMNALTLHPTSGTYFALAEDTDGDLELGLLDRTSGQVLNIGATTAGMEGLGFGPGSPDVLASNEVDDGSYMWTVPFTPTNSGKIEITVHDSEGRTATDMTDGYVNIVNNVEVGKPPVTTVAFLAPATPNPFRSMTTIQFGQPMAGPARLAIFDLRGRLVRELIKDELPAGRITTQWDGTGQNGSRVASGLYFLRLETGGQLFHRMVTYLR
jgi:hypothetical protein